MEPPSFTKKSAVPASPTADDDALDGLDFPVAPDFESALPAASLEVVYLACEQMLSTALAIPGELERRRAEGIAAEFVM